MKTITTTTTTKTQIDMTQFESAMLAAEASGAVDLIVVPVKPAKSKIIFGKFFPKTPEYLDTSSLELKVSKYVDSLWEPTETRKIMVKRLRDDYMNYMVVAYKNCFVGDPRYNLDIDEVSSALGLEYNELRIDCPFEGGWESTEGEKEGFDYAARVFGFLAAIKEGNFYALNVVKSKLAGRGYNSPAQNLSVLGLAENSGCWNPGKLNRAIFATQEAAMKKHGVRISLWVAARAVAKAGVKANGKTATIAYAISLGWNEWDGNYTSARQFVIDVIMAKRESGKVIPRTVERYGARARMAKVMVRNGWDWRYENAYLFSGKRVWSIGDSYENIERPFINQIPRGVNENTMRKITFAEKQNLIVFSGEVGGLDVVDTPKTLKNKKLFQKSKKIVLEGVDIMAAREFTKGEYKFLYGWVLEQVNDGSNRVKSPLPRLISVEELPTGEIFQLSTGWESSSISNALSVAVSAFQKRAAAKLLEQEIEEVVSPDKGVLVYLKDSYDVGNCQSGTVAWVERMGLSGKKLAPLYKIHAAAEESNNDLARNVVKSVVAKYLAENKEVA